MVARNSLFKEDTDEGYSLGLLADLDPWLYLAKLEPKNASASLEVYWSYSVQLP